MSEAKTEAAPETVSKVDYEKVVSRAQNLEGKLRDLEIKFEKVKDIDPEAFKGMKEDYDLMKRKQAAGNPDDIAKLVTEKEAEIRASVQKELDAERMNKKLALAELRELKLVDKVFTPSAQKIRADCSDDVKRYIREHGEVDDEGNIFFKGQDGKPLYAKGSTTQLMTGDQFIEWLSEKKPSFFEPVQISGVKKDGSKAPHVNGKIYTMSDLAAMPDKGKSILSQMTPEQLKQIR